MKENYICNLKKDDEIMGFFLIKRIEAKTGSNQKKYLDLMLSDRTGDISGKKWSLTDEEIEGAKAIEEGEIVKVKGQVTEWNGMKQLKVSRIRKTNKEDEVTIEDFFKAAPEPASDMYDYIFQTAEKMKDAQLRELCTGILDENREKLRYYPAAAKNHHAEMAGLLWHIKRMIMSGKALCPIYTNLDEDLLIAGIILHDMEKLREIDSNEMGISSGYSFEGQMLGHLVMGVRELEKRMEALDFDREKAVMIQHMVLSHHYEPEFGSPVRPLFPEAEMLHYLDVVDARMYDMEEALNKTSTGEFSDRIWVLHNRRLYKKGGEAID